MSPGEEKRRLRRACREKLKEIPPDAWREISRRVCERLIISPEYLRAGEVFCFVGCGDEIDTRLFLRRAAADGKRVCVPRCGERGEMDIVPIRGEGDLSPGRFGIPEPPESMIKDDPGRIADEKKVLIMMPGLAFDKEGNRIGYGGGFYDKYLDSHPDTEFQKIALCFDFQIYDQIPTEEHDEKMDLIISPSETIEK